MDKICSKEEAARSAKAVSLANQGRWTQWARVKKRNLWGMELKCLSLIVIATYDILPTPIFLYQFYGEDPRCALCPRPASLKHILTGCKVNLGVTTKSSQTLPPSGKKTNRCQLFTTSSNPDMGLKWYFDHLLC